MLLQMIGMQFNQAGDQIIALEIETVLRPLALADLADEAVVDDRIAFEGAVGGDHGRIAEGERTGGKELHRSGSVLFQKRLRRKGAKIVERVAQPFVAPVPPRKFIHAF